MFDVNVKILSELKNFITIVSSNKELPGKFCSSDKDFSRSRKLPFDKLAFFIIKLCKKTLSVGLERYFEGLNNTMPCSVSAFTQQRCKLHFSFFYWWMRYCTEAIISIAVTGKALERVSSYSSRWF